MQRAPSDPPVTPVSAEPDPEREPEAADEPTTNFLVRFLANLDPAEGEVLRELADLDRLHGDKPTPRK